MVKINNEEESEELLGVTNDIIITTKTIEGGISMELSSPFHMDVTILLLTNALEELKRRK